jgi:subtilisin family serine protease
VLLLTGKSAQARGCPAPCLLLVALFGLSASGDVAAGVRSSGQPSLREFGPVPVKRPQGTIQLRELIFKLREGAAARVNERADPQQRATADQEHEARRQRIVRAHRLAGDRALFERTRRQELKRLYRARVPANQSFEGVLRRLRQDPDIEWVEINGIFGVQTEPNDPGYIDTSYEYLTELNLEQAWDAHTGSADVVVAVIDTGVNYGHADLSANIWTNTAEIADDGLDNDDNGFIDDIRGWDFVTVSAAAVAAGEDPGPPDNDPMDFDGHGTHIAGVIGARGNNSIGITGVAWQVSLMVLRAGYRDPSGAAFLQFGDIAEALAYACDNGAHIVNMSFGGTFPSRTVREVIDYCRDQGVLMVAGAGNAGSQQAFFPAAHDGVFAVANYALGSGRKALSSNYGIWVDAAAPGDNILSTTVDGGYESRSGTSVASAIVSGLAALLKSAHPQSSATELAIHLQASARNLNSHEPVYFPGLGAGLVQADLTTEMQDLPVNLNPVSVFAIEGNGNGDDAYVADEEVVIRPTIRNFSGSVRTAEVSLQTADPHVEVTNNAVTLPPILPQHWVTGSADSLRFVVRPSAPIEHSLEYTLTVRSAGTMVSEGTFSLVLNPTFRQERLVSDPASQLQFFHPVLVELNDGRLLLLYECWPTFQFYYRVRSVAGEWGPILAFHNPSGQPQNIASAAVGSDGRVHLVYRQWEGSFDMEVYYGVFDPATDAWQITALTSGAGLVSSETNLPSSHSKPAIFIDDTGNPRVAWSDWRDGTGDLYTRTHDGSNWLPEQRALDLDLDLCGFDYYLDATGKPILIWHHSTGCLGQTEVSYSRLDGGVWSAPAPVSSLTTGAHLATARTPNGEIHVELGGDGAPAHVVFDGAVWTERPQSMYVPLMTIDRAGQLNGFQFFLPGFYRAVWDGSTWGDRELISRDGRIQDETSTAILHLPDGELFLAMSDKLNFSFETMPLITLSSKPAGSIGPGRPAISLSRAEDDLQLSATLASDGTESLAGYRVALGTAPGLDNLSPWFDSSSDGCVTFICLNGKGPILDTTVGHIAIDLTTRGPLLDNQAYFVSARALDGIGRWSSVGTAFDIFADFDSDAVEDALDNCPSIANESQTNSDNDAEGDECDEDDDNDGLTDSVEVASGLDPTNPDDAEEDFDGDGLSNRVELDLGTDLNQADTDRDGMSDGDEVAAGRNPLVNVSSLTGIIKLLLE